MTVLFVLVCVFFGLVLVGLIALVIDASFLTGGEHMAGLLLWSLINFVLLVGVGTAAVFAAVSN